MALSAAPRRDGAPSPGGDEREAGVIGTCVAEAAGYDAGCDACLFARPEPTLRQDGALSFWGTHLPDADRFAVVIEPFGRSFRRRPGPPTVRPERP